MRFDRTTPGTAATGLGSGLSIGLEDAGGNLEEAGAFDVELTDATAGTTDSRINLSVLLMSNLK